MGEPTSEQLHWNQLRKQFLIDEKAPDYFEVAKTQLDAIEKVRLNLEEFVNERMAPISRV